MSRRINHPATGHALIMPIGRTKTTVDAPTNGAAAAEKGRARADENAVEGAARELRRMIFDGELRASQPLRQEDLALHLGTSRHPVREALGRLSGEGLVDFRPLYGYAVRALGADEITEIFEMRMVLEEHAGFVATLRHNSQAIADVADVLRRMSELKDKKSSNFRLWCAYNREFHARLFAASGRRHLCRIIETLRDSMETYIRMSVPDVGIGQIHAEHLQIFAAFRDGDAMGAARLCRQHVRHTAHSLVERLRGVQPRKNDGGEDGDAAAAGKRKPRGTGPSAAIRRGAPARIAG
jgi:DNA-binding GntR family transcriptional regulator